MKKIFMTMTLLGAFTASGFDECTYTIGYPLTHSEKLVESILSSKGYRKVESNSGTKAQIKLNIKGEEERLPIGFAKYLKYELIDNTLVRSPYIPFFDPSGEGSIWSDHSRQSASETIFISWKRMVKKLLEGLPNCADL